ncbi:MAG: porin [Holosporaceae bacterium]|jgi:hypothetical protein|nr:porin [Holosporaceae bacterium]
MNYKSSLFLLFLSATGAFAATRDFEGVNLQDEGLLLGELIVKKLEEYRKDKEYLSDIDLYFGGQLHFTTLFINQDQKRSTDDNAVSSLQGDIELRCLKRYHGNGYGVEVKAKANSGIIKIGYPIMRVAFLFFESDKIGTIRVGYTNTAGDLFSICGDKFLAGYLGAGSCNFNAFYNNSAGSIIDTGFTYDDSKAAKIVWLSPLVSGFSAGLSFTFDSRQANLFKTYRNRAGGIHERANLSGLKANYSKNVITGGLSYEFGSPDDFNAKFSIAGWFGNGEPAINGAKNMKVHNVRAYNVGAAMGYKKIRISFGYTDNGKSLINENYAAGDSGAFDENACYSFDDRNVGLSPGADAGKIYSAGIAYSLGKTEISAGYFCSTVKFSDSEKSKANIVTLAVEHKFDRFLKVYVEYDRINTDSCDRARILGKSSGLSPTGKNAANMFMIGSKINF